MTAFVMSPISSFVALFRSVFIRDCDALLVIPSKFRHNAAILGEIRSKTVEICQKLVENWIKNGVKIGKNGQKLFEI